MRNGRRKNNQFSIAPASTPVSRSTIPPHLANTTWVQHEHAAALAAFGDLKRDLKRLKKKVSADRVHRARVTLRRWFSVWKVLQGDGWESKKFKTGIGKTLKKLQKLLGKLRDTDVNLEQAEKFGCGDRLVELWKAQRRTQKQHLEEFVDEADFKSLLSDLHDYIGRRSKKIESKLPRAKASQSAFNHLELYLLEQETMVRDESETASTPEEYHKLRLSIKFWRYMLTEFFGLTNLELVRAQQLLGQLHDIDRLTPMLLNDDEQRQALQKAKERREELLAQINEMRPRLPYGLRPQVTSRKGSFPADSGGVRT